MSGLQARVRALERGVIASCDALWALFVASMSTAERERLGSASGIPVELAERFRGLCSSDYERDLVEYWLRENGGVTGD